MPEKEWHSFRALSKVDYGATVDHKNIEASSFDPVAKGAILRIADALEVMTKDKAELAEDSFALRNTNILLQDEIKRIQEREKKTEAYWRNAQAYGEKMERSRNALRGVITKLQLKLAGK